VSTRALGLAMVLGFIPLAQAQEPVRVELVPDPPGPYFGGESVTAHVWLHNRFAYDAAMALVRFDFSDTDPSIALDPTFTFDYSSLYKPPGRYDFGTPQLPVPWTLNATEVGCPEGCPTLFLTIPLGGSLHAGTLELRLPSAPGAYRMDALNADDPDPAVGAWVRGGVYVPFDWRAYDGEITGGTQTFTVLPPIPVLSGWGALGMLCGLLGAGCVVLWYRRTNPGGVGICRPTDCGGWGQVIEFPKNRLSL